MEKEQLTKRIAVAAKQMPADLVIKGGKIVDVFNLQIKEADVAICDGVIVGIGEFTGIEEVDARGQYIAPSFIDAHVHIESSMATPKEFAKIVLPHGVTTVVTDPHEIANVSGTDGISFMLEDSEGLDLDVFVMLPSSVPATSFENAGAILHDDHLRPFYTHPRVLGLAEVMDFSAVRDQDDSMMEKLLTARKKGKRIDGHCAGLNDDAINIYRAAGIETDHESVSKEEIEMKISRGMYVLIREGTTTRNLAALLPMVTPYNARRFMFCTDDKEIDQLLEEGSIDYNVRLAIELGMDPLQAIQLASLNAAECYGLRTKGAVAPGFDADLLILDDLQTLQIAKVMKNGKIVAENGKYTGDVPARKSELSARLTDSVHFENVSEKDLQLYIGSSQARVIEIVPEQAVTKPLIVEVETEDGYFVADLENDLLKIAVIERHKNTGNIGLGIVKGLNLKSGAIASTVAHDSHNIVVSGTNDRDMLVALEAIRKMKGGQVVVNDGKVIGQLHLDIAGLMSSKPYDEIIRELQSLRNALASISKDESAHIFITFSFLSLPVIPEWKLTDQGLFDVVNFRHIPVAVN